MTPKILTLAALLVATTPAAALAAPPAIPATPAGYVGNWAVGGDAEGSLECKLSLGGKRVAHGWEIKPDRACFKEDGLLPVDVAAWAVYPGGDIGFIGPSGKLQLRFKNNETGYYAVRIRGWSVSMARAPVSEPDPGK